MTLPRLTRSARLRWDHRSERFMLLYPERGLVLNDAAYVVLSLCNGQRRTHEMARILARRFAVDDVDSVLASLNLFLGRLDKLGVLESAEHS
jgi:pyrroloquinoline quinone biosynthesis protein D